MNPRIDMVERCNNVTFLKFHLLEGFDYWSHFKEFLKINESVNIKKKDKNIIKHNLGYILILFFICNPTSISYKIIDCFHEFGTGNPCNSNFRS